MKEEIVQKLVTEILEASPKTITRSAIVHSKEKDGVQQVRISNSHDENGTYLALIDGEFYTTIFNPFVSLFYVDDLYGKVEKK